VTPDEHQRVSRYLRDVRRGLRGLPPGDVDDTIEEIRAHLLEEIGERQDVTAVLADFGDAAEVASGIVRRRLRPEDGAPVPQASLGRRYSAWATDMVVGLGPLVIVPTVIGFTLSAAGHWSIRGAGPIWLMLSQHVAAAWIGDPAVRAAHGLADLPAIPAWQWVLLAAMLAWALVYWLVLRRARSASVGMWMTGLRAVRVDDDRLVVRERDIAQAPAPLGAGRNRWWILLAAVPVGCWCILLALFYVSAGVGAFLAPWQQTPPAEAWQRTDREEALISDFAEAIVAEDIPAAVALCAPEARDQALAALSRLRRPAEVLSVSGGGGVWVLRLSGGDLGSGTTYTVTARVTVSTHRAGNTYTETYLIRAIEVSPGAGG